MDDDVRAILPDSMQKEFEEAMGVPLVTILYSRDRDLYRLAAINKGCWLSVMSYPLPATPLPINNIYLGPVMSPDGAHWRRSYSATWPEIVAGDKATVPANDPMVIDFQAAP